MEKELVAITEDIKEDDLEKLGLLEDFRNQIRADRLEEDIGGEFDAGNVVDDDELNQK